MIESTLYLLSQKPEPAPQPIPIKIEGPKVPIYHYLFIEEPEENVEIPRNYSNTFFETYEYQLRKKKEAIIKNLTYSAVASTNYSLLPELETRPLIIFTYFETPSARKNAVYFIRHGLHGSADFIFIFNGETDLYEILPQNASNIKIIRRNNTCFDLGSVGEVLRSNNYELVNKYKRFIILNASIRGPFIPTWSAGCWSDLFLNKITNEVKLVGMTHNCYPIRHVQSMIFATDRIGIEILLAGNTTNFTTYQNRSGEEYNKDFMVGLSQCFPTKNRAIIGEISLTHLIKRSAYNYTVMMTAASAIPNYFNNCTHIDVNWNGNYFGYNIHPFETVFTKANRDLDPQMLETLTDWYDSGGYSSWEACKVK
ncbi:MAG: hypothetical protein EOP34_09845 [Rickettsiales bacterium]|nr:MAG: hypothetical protein EOP34_09845 [Rickettsiales bacterium]